MSWTQLLVSPAVVVIIINNHYHYYHHRQFVLITRYHYGHQLKTNCTGQAACTTTRDLQVIKYLAGEP